MGDSDLPKIVIAINISCCDGCLEKLTKLLNKLKKTNDVNTFDINGDKGLLTVRGKTDPGKLVISISKAIHKKNTKLVSYDIPKKKSPEKKTEEKVATDGKEKAKETKGKQVTNGKEKAKETKGKQVTNGKEKNGNSNHFGLTNRDYHGHNIIDLHGTHNNNANPDHFGPAPENPHYPPSRGQNCYIPVHQDPSHQYFPGPTHYPVNNYGLAHQDMGNQYYPGPSNRPMNGFEPIGYGMVPPQQYGSPCPPGYSGQSPLMQCPPNDYYGAREGRVSSTDGVCDYLSDENAAGCTIM